MRENPSDENINDYTGESNEDMTTPLSLTLAPFPNSHG